MIAYPRMRSHLLNSLAAQFVTNVPKNIRRGVEHIRPIVEERRQYLNEYGKDWTEKPVGRKYLRSAPCSFFFSTTFCHG